MRKALSVALPACAIAVLTLLMTNTPPQGISMAAETSASKPLAHIVYFELNDSTPENREKLVKACKKYLTKHEGELYFGVGTVAGDLSREVNQKDWDVGLHIVFNGKAAHDKYADHPRHVEFINECKSMWKKVRVFDSYFD
ncbi:MAG: Dabb family protein [Planctomycetales bacterium]